MKFNLPKCLERAVLGITCALVVAGTPLYVNAAKNQDKNISNYNISLFSPNQYYSKKYEIITGKNDKKRILFAAKREKEPVSLEVLFGVDEPEKAFGKKIEPMNLMPIDSGFSRFVVLYPGKAKINQIEQEAYIPSERKFIKLVPLKDSPIKKTILESGEDVLDSVTSIFPGINPLKSIKNRVIESNLTKEEKEYSKKAKDLEGKFGEEYTFEKIPFFQQKGFTEKVETKRKIKVYFDTKNLEGINYIQAMLRPSIGNSSTPTRGNGEWINVGFLMQGEKLPSWIKKQEIIGERTISLESLRKILEKRKNNELAVYDSNGERAIIYSPEEKKIEEMEKNRSSDLGWLNIFLSVEKDIKKEGFSNEGTILIKNKNKVVGESLYLFYKECRELEKK
jgi:hypothetical protein